MSDGRNGTLLRKQLGGRLRGLREERGLTIDQVAAVIGISRPTISRIETGKGTLRKLVLDALLRAYAVSEQEARVLAEMADSAREPNWWDAYRDSMPHRFDMYVGLEGSARQVCVYDSQYISALLQTPDYAREAIIGIDCGRSAKFVKGHVELRLRRQRRLVGEDSLSLSAILDESVLLRPVGGARVMADALRHLLELTELPNVTVQVLPLAHGAHPGLEGPFTVLSFDDHGEVAYVESQAGGTCVEDQKSVDRLSSCFALLSGIALDPSASTKLIAEAASRYGEMAALEQETTARSVPHASREAAVA